MKHLTSCRSHFYRSDQLLAELESLLGQLELKRSRLKDKIGGVTSSAKSRRRAGIRPQV